jgi:hypothetical protein
MMPTVATMDPPSAIVQKADRKPRPKFLPMFVAAVAASAPPFRLPIPYVTENRRPNWLKMALNAQK